MGGGVEMLSLDIAMKSHLAQQMMDWTLKISEASSNSQGELYKHALQTFHQHI